MKNKVRRVSGWSDKPAEFWAHATKILTDRELDVLRLRAEGKGTYRIAAILGISGSRVKELRAQADRKMRCEVQA